VVFRTEDVDTYPAVVRSTVDDEGDMHIVWSEWRPPLGGEEVYYAQMDAETGAWREPSLLISGAAANTTSDWSEIVFHEGELIVFIQTSLEKLAQHMLRSLDDGVTWSAPQRAFPGYYGGNGNVAAVVDGSGTLRAVFCNRTEDNKTHGAWHSVWSNGQWAPGAAIVSGEKSAWFDPTVPEAVVLQGNVLFAAWHMDGAPGAFYAYRVLEDVPPLPITPLPTAAAAAARPPTSVPSRSAAVTVRATAEPRPTLDAALRQPVAALDPSPMLPVLSGSLAAAAVVGAALFSRRGSRKRRHDA